MIGTGVDVPTRAALDWAVEDILRPAVKALLGRGVIRRGQRYASDEEFIDAVEALFRAQLDLLAESKRQRTTDLTRATGYTYDEVVALLEAIVPPELFDDLRFRASSRGMLPLSESSLVIKCAPKALRGPNVFATAAPRPPTFLEPLLEDLGRLPDWLPPQNARSTDSSVWLVELSPKWRLALRVEPLPEGTWFDPSCYPEPIREQIAESLFNRAGGEYEINTRRIIEERLLESLFRGIADHGRSAELPIRVESGWLCAGVRAERYRFMGGDLAMIKFIERLGATPFLDLPRQVLRSPSRGSHADAAAGAVSLQRANCSFRTEDGMELSGTQLTWAAGDALRTDRALARVFTRISDTVVHMAGTDPDEVAYARAKMWVGRPGASRRRRVPVWILVRNVEGVTTSGWALPGVDLIDEFAQRTAIEDGERHVRRMAPDGDFDMTVRHHQAAGIQSMGIELARIRCLREGLIRAADVIYTRAALGL